VRPVEEALAFVTGATAREPVIVDAGFSRDLDVAVVSPVDDFLTATSDTVWDATLQQVAEAGAGATARRWSSPRAADPPNDWRAT